MGNSYIRGGDRDRRTIASIGLSGNETRGIKPSTPTRPIEPGQREQIDLG